MSAPAATLAVPGRDRPVALPALAFAFMVLSVALLIVLPMAPDALDWSVKYPRGWRTNVAAELSVGFKYASRELRFGSVTFSEITRGIAWVFEQPLNLIKGALADGFTTYLEGGGKDHVRPLPWLLITVLLVIGALRAAGWDIALFIGLTLLYCAVFGLWQQSMQTFASVVVAVAIGILVGLGLGLLGYRSAKARMVLTPIYDVMQTLPVFSYLVPVLIFFGFGPVAAVIATVIFAMPPMARATTLALQLVPSTVQDFATVVGCTRRQKTWRVLIPAARGTLLVGVNQAILLSLAMVIIASVIGAGGLGGDVLGALKDLKIARGVEAGLAITFMAIAFDRVSRRVATRRPSHERTTGPWHRRHWGLLAALGAVVVLWPLAQQVEWIQTWPESLTFSTGRFWNDMVSYINTNFHAPIKALRDTSILYLLKPTKLFLLHLPWLGVVAFFGALGYAVGGWRIAALCGGVFLLIAVTGYWSKAMLSLYLVIVSVIVAILIGIPLGLWSAVNDRVEAIFRVIIDTVQTLPTLVYLIPVVMLFEVGDFPGFVAIVLYSLAPLIRYTSEGIRLIDPQILEGSRMSGCSRLQQLVLVQVPLALPQIMLGINQTIMFAFSMLVITALAGTRGLELVTYTAIAQVKPGEGIIAGLGIALMAIAIDRLLRTSSARLAKRLRIKHLDDDG